MLMHWAIWWSQIMTPWHLRSPCCCCVCLNQVSIFNFLSIGNYRIISSPIFHMILEINSWYIFYRLSTQWSYTLPLYIRLRQPSNTTHLGALASTKSLLDNIVTNWSFATMSCPYLSLILAQLLRNIG